MELGILIEILTEPGKLSFYIGWYSVGIVFAFILYQILHPKTWLKPFWKRTSFNAICAVLWIGTIWFLIGALFLMYLYRNRDREIAKKQKSISTS